MFRTPQKMAITINCVRATINIIIYSLFHSFYWNSTNNWDVLPNAHSRTRHFVNAENTETQKYVLDARTAQHRVYATISNCREGFQADNIACSSAPRIYIEIRSIHLLFYEMLYVCEYVLTFCPTLPSSSVVIRIIPPISSALTFSFWVHANPFVFLPFPLCAAEHWII